MREGACSNTHVEVRGQLAGANILATSETQEPTQVIEFNSKRLSSWAMFYHARLLIYSFLHVANNLEGSVRLVAHLQTKASS